MDITVCLRLLILLMLLIFGCVSRESLSFYDGTPGKKLQQGNIFNTFTVISQIDCCARCETLSTCKSVSFEPTSKTCSLSNLTLTEVQFLAQDDIDWTTFSKNDWFLIFRAPAGIGGDVYQSYVNASGVTTDDVNCVNLTSTTCTTNYRHPIIDNWETSNFTKVRYSLYKDQTEAAYVEFEATGNNLTSWFRKEKIVDSTWTNSATDTYESFSIEGLGTSRRFYVVLNYNGCPGDSLYTMTLTWHGFTCDYDAYATYPQFVYANTASPGYPETNTGTDNADFMAIFVKS